MLNLKKQATKMEVGELRVSNCPMCKAYVCHMYYMKDAVSGDTSKWFSCACGVVFQNQLPSGKEDKKEEPSQKLIDNHAYPVKVYSPIVEELGKELLFEYGTR